MHRHQSCMCSVMTGLLRRCARRLQASTRPFAAAPRFMALLARCEARREGALWLWRFGRWWSERQVLKIPRPQRRQNESIRISIRSFCKSRWQALASDASHVGFSGSSMLPRKTHKDMKNERSRIATAVLVSWPSVLPPDTSMPRSDAGIAFLGGGLARTVAASTAFSQVPSQLIHPQ